VTSTYYAQQLPKWAADFNAADHAEKLWNREWKDAAGRVHSTAKTPAVPDFYHAIGESPFGNEYVFDFARELISNEKLGAGAATDLLSISLSANDILGHKHDADSPEMEAMTVATDRQLAEFFAFLDQRLGAANVWIALTADHGISPTRHTTEELLRMPAASLLAEQGPARAAINTAVSNRLGKGAAEYVPLIADRALYLDAEAFTKIGISRAEAERLVAEIAIQPEIAAQLRIRAAFGHSQIAGGEVPKGQLGTLLSNSMSYAYRGWYVLTLVEPFSVLSKAGTDHGASWSYDTHVPLAFYGAPFRPGTYRGPAEPIDLAVTLASLLGINKPSHASGRVLTEALKPESASTASAGSR
jgi:arylsulfatase A-like enzyme